MKYTFTSVLILLGSILFGSCDSKSPEDFENRPVQTVTVGEKVSIYFTTNSCCEYCSPNMENLEHLEYIGEEVKIPYPSDCDGCNETVALVFEAKSKGTDTVVGRILDRRTDCSDTLSDFESFIIHIK